MPVPSADETAAMRTWFQTTGIVDAECLDVILGALAQWDTAPAITAPRLQNLTAARDSAPFVDLLSDAGVRAGPALRSAQAHFTQVARGVRTGARQANVGGTASVHQGLARAVVAEVTANAGRGEREQVEAAAQVIRREMEESLSPQREQEESVSAYCQAVFKHGPGSDKLGGFMHGGGDGLVVEEMGTSQGTRLMVVGKDWKSWGRDSSTLRKQFQKAANRASKDGMVGLRERLIKVSHYLENVEEWETRKELFEAIMAEYECTLPLERYTDLKEAITSRDLMLIKEQLRNTKKGVSPSPTFPDLISKHSVSVPHKSSSEQQGVMYDVLWGLPAGAAITEYDSISGNEHMDHLRQSVGFLAGKPEHNGIDTSDWFSSASRRKQIPSGDVGEFPDAGSGGDSQPTSASNVSKRVLDGLSSLMSNQHRLERVIVENNLIYQASMEDLLLTQEHRHTASHSLLSRLAGPAGHLNRIDEHCKGLSTLIRRLHDRISVLDAQQCQKSEAVTQTEPPVMKNVGVHAHLSAHSTRSVRSQTASVTELPPLTPAPSSLPSPPDDGSKGAKQGSGARDLRDRSVKSDRPVARQHRKSQLVIFSTEWKQKGIKRRRHPVSERADVDRNLSE
jgi:hypothetical protein